MIVPNNINEPHEHYVYVILYIMLNVLLYSMNELHHHKPVLLEDLFVYER